MVQVVLPEGRVGSYGEWSSGPNDCRITNFIVGYGPDGLPVRKIYKIVPNTNGELIRFRISVCEKYAGYKNPNPIVLDCEARGSAKERFLRMNLKPGSRVYIHGNMRFETYSKNKGDLRMVIEVTSIDFKN